MLARSWQSLQALSGRAEQQTGDDISTSRKGRCSRQDLGVRIRPVHRQLAWPQGNPAGTEAHTTHPQNGANPNSFIQYCTATATATPGFQELMQLSNDKGVGRAKSLGFSESQFTQLPLVVNEAQSTTWPHFPKWISNSSLLHIYATKICLRSSVISVPRNSQDGISKEFSCNQEDKMKAVLLTLQSCSHKAFYFLKPFSSDVLLLIPLWFRPH